MPLAAQLSGVQGPNTICGLATSAITYPHWLNIDGSDLILGCIDNWDLLRSGATIGISWLFGAQLISPSGKKEPDNYLE